MYYAYHVTLYITYIMLRYVLHISHCIMYHTYYITLRNMYIM